MSSFSVGDPNPTIGCTAIDPEDGEIKCDWTGTINTSLIGEYTIIYEATDSSNNTTTLEMTYVVLRDNTLLSIDMSAYYNNAEGLYGQALLEALRTIIQTGATINSYDAAITILQSSDEDPDNSNNILLVYSGYSVPKTWDGGATWNREHVWPQSLLNGATANDAHNLKPANPGFNSSRGNKYFDDVGGTQSYVPRDEVKGDVARILFYMIVMYQQLELINGTPIDGQMAMLDTLIRWHETDLVDIFEQNRNNVIFSFQNNRNPFIDYPHLLELLFFDNPYYQNLIS